MKKRRFKNDIILIALLILIPVVMLVTSNMRNNETNASYVKITVSGEHYMTLSLNENTEIDVQSENGFNHIVIANHEVWVSDADCLNRICVDHNPVFRNGEQIVCLPHRVVIEIISDIDSEVDSISQ